MADILTQIVEKRKADIERLGLEFGFDIPKERTRPVHNFLPKKGVILEVKRASPSKGDIAPALDSGATARSYAEAGAAAISCLTETNYFKGTLKDLMNVCKAVDQFEAETGMNPPAVLRKDFLLNEEEVEVAWRAGADAVLLIARILETDTMIKMAKTAASHKMTSLVEVRSDEDIEKLSELEKAFSSAENSDEKTPLSSDWKNYIVCGVNSRDLATFTIDLLKPCSLLSKIKSILGENARVIFESGIRTPQAASFAGSLGFQGMLLGEAAAKNPDARKSLVRSFVDSEETKNAAFWNDFSTNEGNTTKPFVKICGITNEEDGIKAASSGADFLGFIFYKKSPRNADESVVRKLRETSSKKLVGVIVNPSSEEGKTAIKLCKEGVLDALQLHTAECALSFLKVEENRKLPHYAAVNIAREEDISKIDELFELGEPRVLVDAKLESDENCSIGGTGKRISSELVEKIAQKHKLWLAGGINPENVQEIVQNFKPELIDISSGLEATPGKKDHKKIDDLFENIAKTL